MVFFFGSAFLTANALPTAAEDLGEENAGEKGKTESTSGDKIKKKTRRKSKGAKSKKEGEGETKEDKSTDGKPAYKSEEQKDLNAPKGSAANPMPLMDFLLSMARNTHPTLEREINQQGMKAPSYFEEILRGDDRRHTTW